MSNTKLFKIFNKRECFFIISLIAIFISCNNEMPKKNEPHFLHGEWKFISIETNQTQNLDQNSRELYDNELKAFTNESELNIQDSTYTCTLGQTIEKGLWKYHPTDSILSLKTQLSDIQMFKVSFKNEFLSLLLKKSASGEKWILKK